MEEDISKIIAQGESQEVEFKESVSSSLAKELVAFANSKGGMIVIGISDSGELKGTDTSNAVLSQIQDLARNCDPPISIKISKFKEGILKVNVPESSDKPHQCREGFFIRTGASSQKLRRDELISVIVAEGTIGFDRAINRSFNFPSDFSQVRFERFRTLLGASAPADVSLCLRNLEAASVDLQGSVRLSNAAVLFFAESPQKFFSESFLTCVKYGGLDRTQVVDRHDITGSLIEQIEAAFEFVTQRQQVSYRISTKARREERYEYPLSAIREAIVNAVMHRDYFYQSSHVYVSLYADRLEVENPGGLIRGMQVKDLGSLSYRRNPLIANLLQRAGYVEALGSGISRIKAALKTNGNPDFLVEVANHFRLTIYPSEVSLAANRLTKRQERLLSFLKERKQVSRRDAADWLSVSEDTALRDLKTLIEVGVAKRQGVGKGIMYCYQELTLG